MIGSAGVAALIAHLAFWVLIAGLVSGELGRRGAWMLVALWAAGRFGLPYLPPGDLLFTPYIAVLDVVLVLIVFRGDVRLH